MVSLENVEKINQILGCVETYALLLSEKNVLDTQTLEKPLTEHQLYNVCKEILILRLNQNPDLSWNKNIWDSLFISIPRDELVHENHVNLEILSKKTGYIIGL